MNFDQGEFDFDAKGSEAGFRKWREELDAKKRAFERRWGVILSKRVRVELRDYAKPLTGVLEWVSDPKTGRQGPPVFRLKGAEFGVGEIVSIVQEDTP
jgi:hypothetical protein